MQTFEYPNILAGTDPAFDRNSVPIGMSGWYAKLTSAGDGFIKVAIANANYDGPGIYPGCFIGRLAAGEYTVAFEAYSDVDATPLNYNYLIRKNSYNLPMQTTYKVLTTTPKVYSASFSLGEDQEDVSFMVGTNSHQTIYIRHMMLVAGGVPRAWAPAAGEVWPE